MTRTDTRYGVFALGENIFGSGDIPTETFGSLEAAEDWAENNQQPGRSWAIREFATEDNDDDELGGEA